MKLQVVKEYSSVGSRWRNVLLLVSLSKTHILCLPCNKATEENIIWNFMKPVERTIDLLSPFADEGDDKKKLRPLKASSRSIKRIWLRLSHQMFEWNICSATENSKMNIWVNEVWNKQKSEKHVLFLEINSRDEKIKWLMSLKFNFHPIGVSSKEGNRRRCVYYFSSSGRRRIRGSHKYWWDSIKSSEKWMWENHLIGRRASANASKQINDSCHKRYWFMQIKIFV